MFNPKNLKESVLATLAYFSIWKHPLLLEEINEYLFKFKADIRHIELYLKESPKIEFIKNIYILKKKRESLIERYNAQVRADKLWKKVHFFSYLMHLIPNVRMIAVCNTLAIDHPNEESDIDLLVVTKKNRLFTTRLFLTALLQLFAVRRHGHKIKGRFCLSFFIDETHLNLNNLQLLPYDIYLAYWTRTLQPLIGKKTFQKFMKENQNWMKRYFLQPDIIPRNHLVKTLAGFILRTFQLIGEIIINNPIGDKIEEKLSDWQIKRARAKQKNLTIEKHNIVIKKNILKFHNLDRREEYRQIWESILIELKITD